MSLNYCSLQEHGQFSQTEDRRAREQRIATEWSHLCSATGKADFAVRGQSCDYLGMRIVVETRQEGVSVQARILVLDLGAAFMEGVFFLCV